VNTEAMRRSNYLVAIVFAVFFVISFITNILGPIIPDIIQSFHVSLFAAALLPFFFFVAYGLFSIPAGFLVERWGEKQVIVGMFLVAFIGSILFAWLHTFTIAMVSLFLIGSSMAALQVAINPLLRVAGGEEHFAFNSAFAQLIFGIGSFLSPQVYAYMIVTLEQAPGRNVLLSTLSAVVPVTMRWISMYWLFAIVIAAVTLALAFTRFPDVERKEDETAGTAGMYRSLVKLPVVWLYFFSIFFYVGSEQGTANWMSEFLWRYHGYDPHTAGASAVAWFWGSLTLGCFVGMILLKLYDSRRVLGAFGIGAVASLTLALFGSAAVSRYAFPCIGLFGSVMWPIVVSLALNSVSEFQGAFAGILCSGIVGGAILPLIEGRIADSLGLRTGMCILYVSFGWVFAVSLWARPLITNRRSSREDPKPKR
jgi:MFS transporter, FHS family, L-fucose permease